jgi:hypothetical protein
MVRNGRGTANLASGLRMLGSELPLTTDMRHVSMSSNRTIRLRLENTFSFMFEDETEERGFVYIFQELI